MKTPVLETERLILRSFKMEDVKDVFEGWESDSDVAKYMTWTSHNDINKTIDWLKFEINQIEKEDWYRFALIEKETGQLIGTGLIYYIHEELCWSIAYNLAKKYWGNGYTIEAMKEILIFAKEELGIKEIIGGYAKENQASENVMRKLGFRYEKDIPYECNNGTVIREGKLHRLNL